MGDAFKGALVALFSISLASTEARANGRFPASSAAVIGAGEASSTVLVRTTFGVVVSKDRGKTWDFICERAIGFSGIEDPTYLVTKSGALVAGTFEGLAVSRDGGCEWSVAAESVFSDLALRADGTIAAMHSVYAKSTGKGIRYDNSLWISKDDARTFERVGGPIDDTLLLETVEVADSDPSRIVISAVRGDGTERNGVLLVSKDAGLHFTEIAIPFVKGERGAYIAAIDSTNADRVYVRTAGDPDSASRLIAFDKNWPKGRQIFATETPLSGFALSPDGSRIFAGARTGVWTAEASKVGEGDADAGYSGFEPRAKFEVQCLAAGANDIFACSSERNGFFVGRSTDGAARFEASVHLDGLRGPLACGAGTTVGKQCQGEWPRLQRELGIPDKTKPAPSAVPSAMPASVPPAGDSAIGWPVYVVGGIAALGILFAVLRKKGL